MAIIIILVALIVLLKVEVIGEGIEVGKIEKSKQKKKSMIKSKIVGAQVQIPIQVLITVHQKENKEV